MILRFRCWIVGAADRAVEVPANISLAFMFMDLMELIRNYH